MVMGGRCLDVRSQAAGEGARKQGLGLAAVLFGMMLAGLPPGCSSTAARQARHAEARQEERTRLVHEPCALKSAGEALDANGDGSPDFSVVTKQGRKRCQGADFNYDGIVDAWTYFDESGQVRRRELAYSRGPEINEVRLYRGGALAEIHQATNSSGSLDTWHYFQGGLPVRTERDSDGDGKIDEWWEYPNKQKPGCPTMYSDGDGDGKRDQDSSVDLCEHGYVPPERYTHRHKSPTFEREGALPTEVDSREEGSDAEK